MISADDLAHLPFTEDLSDSAIIHLCRKLSSLGTGARVTGSTMRRAIAATCAQLAWRRYLVSKSVEFSVAPSPGFAQDEAPDVMIGRRTLSLESFLISSPRQIDALAEDPELALRAPALVPSDRFAAEAMRDDDVFVFALVSARVDNSERARRQWMYPLPLAWRRPRAWAPLGPITVKSEGKMFPSLELGGQLSRGQFQQIELEPGTGQRQVIDGGFHSIGYVRAAERPAGRIGVRSPARGLSQVIGPAAWESVWLDGQEICILGWITRREFSVRARPVRQGARVFQFAATRMKNLGIEASSLKPIQMLIDLSLQ